MVLLIKMCLKTSFPSLAVLIFSSNFHAQLQDVLVDYLFFMEIVRTFHKSSDNQFMHSFYTPHHRLLVVKNISRRYCIVPIFYISNSP